MDETQRKFNALQATVAKIQKDKPQRRRKLTIEVVIDSDYKWIARQPFGTWVAFKHRPRVYRAVEDTYEDGFVPEFWERQEDENEFCTDGPQGGNWKRSVRRIR